MSTQDLEDKIAEFEDYVQSTDIAAMQSKYTRFHERFYTHATYLQSSDLLYLYNNINLYHQDSGCIFSSNEDSSGLRTALTGLIDDGKMQARIVVSRKCHLRVGSRFPVASCQ